VPCALEELVRELKNKAMSTTTEALADPTEGNPNFSLTRKFAVGAAVIMVLTAAFLVHIHQLATTDQTDRIAEETNGYVIQALSNGLLDKAMPVLDLGNMANVPRRSHPAYQDLNLAAHTYLSGTPILKLKIYDTAGRVAYSTNPAELGTADSNNPRLKAALAGGVGSGYQFQHKLGAGTGPDENIWVLSGYLPMRGGYNHGPVVGVIEIHRNITSIRLSIEQVRMKTAAVIALAFVLLFVLLVTMVQRAEGKTQVEHEAKLALAHAKAKAEAIVKEKTQFLANISHELRTPLNAIIGFAEILESEIKGPLGHPSYKEFISDIARSGHYLLNIINEVLDLAKAESGTMAIDAQPTDVISVANGVSRMLAPEAASYGHTLTVEGIGEISAIKTDAGKLRHVLVNLVNNGLKFTPQGGEVRVLIDQDAETRDLRIRVIDNGIGMSADDIPIAQSPFGQVENVFTRTHKGTGLGLPLSQRFTEILGGTFLIESKPQAGTTVTIILPEKPRPKEEGTDEREAALERTEDRQGDQGSTKNLHRSDAA
jgi:signal transduction histidine kinase